ncbi:hypothetical protein [Pseudophaeobacter sp.]|uniref:hypothetical protein n=1 Tax=Pseudophaeobacter sp. TaxID=1971739 RepID=UPI0032997C95
MRFGIAVIWLLVTWAGAALAQPISYEVRGSMYEQVIIAYVNGTPYQALVPETGISSKILEADFDGDGQVDLLHSWSGGGNCCAPSYAVLSLQNGRFVNATHPEFSGWSEPEVQQAPQGHRFVIETTQAGHGHTDLNGRLSSFAFVRGALQLVESRVLDQMLPALAQLSAEDYNRPGFDKQFPISMNYDLDGSGTPDLLLCRWWERWGAINCEIQMATGRQIAINNSCVRLGILQSRTAGMPDLVCGREDILRFDPFTNSYQ